MMLGYFIITESKQRFFYDMYAVHSKLILRMFLKQYSRISKSSEDKIMHT